MKANETGVAVLSEIALVVIKTSRKSDLATDEHACRNGCEATAGLSNTDEGICATHPCKSVFICGSLT